FGYDDSLDVFGVHGVGGILGALGTGILMSESFGGVGYDKGVTMIGQLTTQAIAVGVTLVWTGIISFILYKIVDMMVGLRAEENIEREGLDSTQHGEVAYHL
ncbi:MAG: ammonia channel protein, partial [Burkholderiales bacterium]|nr:ammonia channel protein [Burkholderiales bacterium]